MKKYDVFDIIGPIMIGPSSSHTAGATRIARMARIVAGEDIKEVSFLLHGSFSKTYKGHGTDRALAAGILGMNPSDIRLRNSLDIAKEVGIKVEFIEANLGEVHPNTVKCIITGKTGVVYSLVGSSIGGGNIQVIEINNQKVDFTGNYPTLIISHKDVPGSVSKVTALLYKENINIAFMKVFRSEKGKDATMLFEVDNPIPDFIMDEIKSINDISKVIRINPIKEGE
ncbi:L-serine ammonia-lyase, iron-sulfur-dependent subunit beta [Clostridium sp. YIM B02551]|uniref:L-serine ammonia-lyase, iron-sulfur-dependent subunit beta n=1 Tax=Clostridium sp. YIM B02551 TaxID=2910679 RepID=UPI001EEA489B|nr:L-serine ammonia-lyase, iron-sulfur-dependent subunit beta [Clostridium sp. YIM B02551]